MLQKSDVDSGWCPSQHRRYRCCDMRLRLCLLRLLEVLHCARTGVSLLLVSRGSTVAP